MGKHAKGRAQDSPPPAAKQAGGCWVDGGRVLLRLKLPAPDPGHMWLTADQDTLPGLSLLSAKGAARYGVAVPPPGQQRPATELTSAQIRNTYALRQPPNTSSLYA